MVTKSTLIWKSIYGTLSTKAITKKGEEKEGDIAKEILAKEGTMEETKEIIEENNGMHKMFKC